MLIYSMPKRAQITLFIMIGLVALFLIIVFFSLRSSQMGFNAPNEALQLAQAKDSFNVYASECAKKISNDAINKNGLEEEKIELYLDKNIMPCISGFNYPGFEINYGNLSSNVSFAQAGDKMNVIMGLNTSIKKGGSEVFADSLFFPYPLSSKILIKTDEKTCILNSTVKLESRAGGLRVIIPANTRIAYANGTCASELGVTLKKVSDLSSNFSKVLDIAYLMEPEIFFNPPIQLDITYNDNDSDGFVDGTSVRENELVIAYNAYPYFFLNIPTLVNTTAKTLSAEISHFSSYSVSNRSLAGVGLANVYLIDPVTTPNLTAVELTDLDGSGYLSGNYVNVANVLSSSGKTPTGSRVKKDDLNFTYKPVDFGSENYFGEADEGHRFDQASAYFHYTTVAKIFKERFGFTPKKPVKIGLYSPEQGGYMLGQYLILIKTPTDKMNPMRDARTMFHEYTHLVTNDLNNLPYTSEDQKALKEAFAKYFEASFTNISYDPYFFSPATGVKDLANYTAWKNREGMKGMGGWIIASAWWQMREVLGTEVADKLVYESQIQAEPSDACSTTEALKATLKSDQIMYSGQHIQNITNIFNQHGITPKLCYESNEEKLERSAIEDALIKLGEDIAKGLGIG